eukprot:6154284-Pleurochrysis_carterae.AAC.5
MHFVMTATPKIAMRDTASVGIILRNPQRSKFACSACELSRGDAPAHTPPLPLSRALLSITRALAHDTRRPGRAPVCTLARIALTAHPRSRHAGADWPKPTRTQHRTGETAATWFPSSLLDSLLCCRQRKRS